MLNKLTRNLTFLICLITWQFTAAQNIEVQQSGKNSFKFTIPESATVVDYDIAYPEYILSSMEAEFKVTALDADGNVKSDLTEIIDVTVNQMKTTLVINNGIGTLSIKKPTSSTKISFPGNIHKNIKIRVIPAWLSILPPLIAILFALIFKEVIISLFLGIFSGALIIYGVSFSSLLRVVDKYFLNALNNADHISIIIFSTLIGGMVALISRNGGMAGVVNKLSKYAKSARSAQLVTWLLGILIFFDDYANTLIVGNTMRPVTDRFKVSRAKLAYIVDSTAAPVAAVAFITTWIGAEISYIKEATLNLGLQESAYTLFLGSLKYAFYPIFTLVFMFLMIWFKKDFGPMLEAEKNQKITPEKEADSDVTYTPIEPSKINWLNAFIPVFTVIITVVVSLYITGSKGLTNDESNQNFFMKLGIIIGNANAYLALVWASLVGILAAIALTIGQRIMKVQETMTTVIEGFKSMTTAMVILIAAWALAGIISDVGTAYFITGVFSNNISTAFLPVIAFILAGLVAFSTGSSWGTMAILYPLLLPTTWMISVESGLDHQASIEVMQHVIAVVLAGAVFGDHCSPISDTTILSSLSSGCNHIEHVRTQLPYALVTGGVSIFASLVLINIGLPWYLSFVVGFGILYGVVRFIGK